MDQSPILGSNGESGLPKIIWNSSKNDHRALKLIVKLGNLLAPLRGSAWAWDTKDTQGSDYAYSTPIIEHPTRAITHLLNLAKGHALLEGRNYISIEDIPILVQTVLSTAPKERVMVFNLLLNTKGEVASSEIDLYLNMSRPTALKTMTELKILGLVEIIKQSDAPNSPQSVRLKKEYEWVLTNQFRILKSGNISEIRKEFGEGRETTQNSGSLVDSNGNET